MLDPDEEGASELVKWMEKYSMEYLNSADLREDENFDGFYDASEKIMMVHAHSDAVTMTAAKLTHAGLAKFGSRININDLASNNTVKNFTAWQNHIETLEIPSSLPFTNTSMCGNKAFTLLTAIYNGFGRMGPLRRNPQSLRARDIKLDSKPISVQIMVAPDPIQIEQATHHDVFGPSYPNHDEMTKNDVSGCELDHEAMRYDPIRIRFYHYDTQTSLRKLLWHDDDLDTNVRIVHTKN